MTKESNAIAWEALLSNIDPLLAEGKSIHIHRANNNDPGYSGDWHYLVEIHDKNGVTIAVGGGYPLTEAMAEAYSMTPEVTE